MDCPICHQQGRAEVCYEHFNSVVLVTYPDRRSTYFQSLATSLWRSCASMASVIPS